MVVPGTLVVNALIVSLYGFWVALVIGRTLIADIHVYLTENPQLHHARSLLSFAPLTTRFSNLLNFLSVFLIITIQLVWANGTHALREVAGPTSWC